MKFNPRLGLCLLASALVLSLLCTTSPMLAFAGFGIVAIQSLTGVICLLPLGNSQCKRMEVAAIVILVLYTGFVFVCGALRERTAPMDPREIEKLDRAVEQWERIHKGDPAQSEAAQPGSK